MNNGQEKEYNGKWDHNKLMRVIRYHIDEPSRELSWTICLQEERTVR
jgi:hypothetical protein